MTSAPDDFRDLHERFLAGDYDAREAAELLTLLENHPEHRREFFATLEAQAVLDEHAAALRAEFPRPVPAGRAAGSFTIRAGWSWWKTAFGLGGVLAAALAVVVVWRLQFFGPVPGDPGENVSGTLALARAHGDCRADARSVAGGGIVEGEPVLRAGAFSLCDWQLRRGAAPVRLRMLPEAEVRATVDPSGSILISLTKGDILVAADKMPAGRSLRLDVPAGQIRFLGTHVYASVKPDGHALAVVLEGAVETRALQIPRDRTTGLRDATVELAESLFPAEAAVVESGRGVEFPTPGPARLAALEKLLEDLRAADVVAEETEQRRQVLAAVRAARERLEAPAVREVELAPARLAALQRMRDSLTATRTGVAQPFSAAELGEVLGPRESTQAQNGYRQKIVLKNGTVIYGVVSDQSENYEIVDDTGVLREVPVNEVERIEIVP